MISTFILLLTVFFPRIYKNDTDKDFKFENIDLLAYMLIFFFFVSIVLNIILSNMNPGYLQKVKE